MLVVDVHRMLCESIITVEVELDCLENLFV